MFLKNSHKEIPNLSYVLASNIHYLLLSLVIHLSVNFYAHVSLFFCFKKIMVSLALTLVLGVQVSYLTKKIVFRYKSIFSNRKLFLSFKFETFLFFSRKRCFAVKLIFFNSFRCETIVFNGKLLFSFLFVVGVKTNFSIIVISNKLLLNGYRDELEIYRKKVLQTKISC